MRSGDMWRGIGARVTGAAHVKNGLPCQDAIRIETYPQGYLVAAVADGHGSDTCPYSDEGAQAAADCIHDVFSGIFEAAGSQARSVIGNTKDIRLPKQIASEWLYKVQSLHTAAGRGDFLPILYGTTVLAVIASPDFIFALQLGDGDILAVEPGQARWLIAPEYLPGNETHSLCMPDCWQYVKTQMTALDGEHHPMIMITTDGYANSFLTHEGFIKAGADIRELLVGEGAGYIESNLEDWLWRSSSKGSGDDISMAIAYFSLT